MERLDLIKHTEKSGLVDDRSAQGCLTVGFITDHQLFEPIGPAIGKMTFNSNLINVGLVHSVDRPSSWDRITPFNPPLP